MISSIVVIYSLLITAIHAVPKTYGSSDIMDSRRGQNMKLCTSIDCLKRSYDIKSAMDLTIDPCVDFYKFTCGRYLNETRVPDDKTSTSIFSTTGEDLLRKGRDILEDKPKEGDWKLDQLPRSLYKDCMDEDAIERLGILPAETRVEKVGGWFNNSRPWYEMSVDLQNVGLSPNSYIVEVSVDIDDSANDRRSIFIDQPDLGVKREYFVSDDRLILKAYEKFMVDTAVLFGNDRQAAEKTVKKVLEFENELAKASMSKEELRYGNQLYYSYLLKDMPRAAGHPPSWHKYVHNLLAFSGINITSTEIAVVKAPDYLEKVAAILEKTDNETINAYLVWRCLQSVMEYLNKEARDILQDFERVTIGRKEQPPRWKQCAKIAGVDNLRFDNMNLDLITGSMYVRRFLKPEAKEQLVDMTEHIRKAFKKVLEDLDWMDQETKSEAFSKLEQMLQSVGYPEDAVDEDKMNKIYEGMVLEDGKFFDNIVSITTFWDAKLVRALRNKVDRNFWLDNPATSLLAVANAWYSPNTNTISFPAGFLSGLMFNSEVPQYANYGGIGDVIGHEISHGFDDVGRQTDATGLLRNWWSIKTTEKFMEKAECLVDQYDKFEVKEVGLKLNGLTTLTENIADIVGAKVARMAYGFWMDEHVPEPYLPGLSAFSPQQMFWIMRGRSWCATYTEARLRKDVITDTHAPSEFRTNGASMNLESFARDFECRVGAPMNPEKKCVVW